MTAPKTPRDLPTPEYEQWCRAQFDAAHHDIWWVKGQQMQMAYWTLLLLGALVAVSALITGPTYIPTEKQKWMLSALSFGAVLLGTYYTWDLYRTLVQSRQRARENVSRFRDPDGVFAPSKKDPKRHWGFPVVLTFAYAVAWGVTLRLFFICWPWWFLAPLLLFVAAWATGRHYLKKVIV